MTERINTAEPVGATSCRPGRFNVEIEFMFWSQAGRFLLALFKTSKARLSVAINETVGGFTVVSVQTSHREGLSDIYDAYDMCSADFVGPNDVVRRNDT